MSLPIYQVKKSANNLTMHLSDHRTFVNIFLTTQKNLAESKVIIKRCFTLNNINIFNKLLANETWTVIYSGNSVIGKLNVFQNIIYHFDVAFPVNRKK